MRSIDSQNLQQIRDLLYALFDPLGFYRGFVVGITFAAGLLIVHLIRSVWGDNED